MEKAAFQERLAQYMVHNFNFGIYYDKIYKKEYLPSRIRYNQFFFYAALGFSAYYFLGSKTGGGMFCPKDNALNQTSELADRKYYTSPRSVVNIFMRQMNSSSAKSHAAKQEYTLWIEIYADTDSASIFKTNH